MARYLVTDDGIPTAPAVVDDDAGGWLVGYAANAVRSSHRASRYATQTFMGDDGAPNVIGIEEASWSPARPHAARTRPTQLWSAEEVVPRTALDDVAMAPLPRRFKPPRPRMRLENYHENWAPSRIDATISAGSQSGSEAIGLEANDAVITDGSASGSSGTASAGPAPTPPTDPGFLGGSWQQVERAREAQEWLAHSVPGRRAPMPDTSPRQSAEALAPRLLAVPDVATPVGSATLPILHAIIGSGAASDEVSIEAGMQMDAILSAGGDSGWFKASGDVTGHGTELDELLALIEIIDDLQA